jgi:transcriptional regulator with XRE-family HTH domain
MISGAQIRAARRLLGWTTRELARRATVSVSTVQLIENAGGSPNASREALAAVQNTLEAEGIEFLVGDAPGCGYIRKCGGGSEPQYQEGLSCGKSR